jgi:hypothetical protein
MIHKKDSCVGITLFRLGRRKLELWYVPKDYACVEHTHKDSDGEFFVVYGKDRFIWRRHSDHKHVAGTSYTYKEERQEIYNITDRPYWKWYTVKSAVPHGFGRGASPMVFLCWETYRKGVKVTSPAIDFHPVTTTSH